MNRTSYFCAVAALGCVFLLNSSSFANQPWVAGVNWTEIANRSLSPEGVIFSVGEGHVIVDFTQAVEASGSETIFVDPLGDDLEESDNQWYDVSTMDDLAACLNGCDRLVDPEDYQDCVDYCFRNNGGGSKSMNIDSAR